MSELTDMQQIISEQSTAGLLTMTIYLQRILHVPLVVLLTAFWLSGCVTPAHHNMIPLEDLDQIELKKTSINKITTRYGKPKAIIKPDTVTSLPAERTASMGRMTPPIYDSSKPYYEHGPLPDYYKIDSDTFFELFKKDHKLTEQHRIYYYSDSILRRGLYEPESRLWILVNSETSLIEDFIYRKHYNAKIDKVILPVIAYSSESAQYSGPLLNVTPQKPEHSSLTPVRRNHWYIGLGALSGELASDNLAFDDRNASGVSLTGGIEMAWHSSFEATMGTFDFKTSYPPTGINYPPDDASFSFFGFAYRFSFLDIDKKKWTPWLALETAQYDVGLSNYVYSLTGYCTHLIYGVDIRLAEWFVLRATRRGCSFTGTEVFFGDTSSEIDSDVHTLHAVFRF